MKQVMAVLSSLFFGLATHPEFRFLGISFGVLFFCIFLDIIINSKK